MNSSLQLHTFYIHNGKIIESPVPVVAVTNYSYRYGDGLFETMKLVNGVAPFASYHFERLFEGMKLLDYAVPGLFTAEKMLNEIKLLAEKNNCTGLARIRLAVSRGNGGVNDCDDKVQYTIECTPAEESINQLNENGLIIDVFPDVRKSCDKFSRLKSSSYLNYVMAARFAKENKLNDALILNQYDRICESSIANIFWIKEGMIFTPPLSEGCVGGVMRRFLLEKLPGFKHSITERPCTITDLENADEFFLTNAVKKIRWVKKFRNSVYAGSGIQKLYRDISVLLRE